ncbi:MAG TPA: hypothetical protein VGK48_16200 [Terriglobia bacterium]|jgi:hypothetical protein
MNDFLIRAISFILLMPCGTFAADLVFSGNLQRVTPASMTVRLDDGGLIDARLAKSGSLAPGAITRYQLGDRMQITCTPSFELKKIQYLRPASAEELSQVVTSLSWRREKNLLKHPDPPAQADRGPAAAQSEFERARQAGLERAMNLPSFVADEVARRWTARPSNPAASKLVDTIESEITIKNGEAARQNIRINGRPWKKAGDPITWSPDFGTELKEVFDVECPNTFDFQGHEEVRGRQLLVYGFSSPPDGCFGYDVVNGKRYIPARKGRILIEEQTGNLLQYEEEASQFPPGFPFSSTREVTRWDYLKSGVATYLVPMGYELFFTFSSGDQWHISAEFKNHRHFQSSVNLTFQPEQ